MTRQTTQKKAILEIFALSKHPLSVAELHQMAQEKLPSLGLATAYRRVKELLGQEHLKQITLPNCSKKYELNPNKHLHYFQCHYCQKTFGLQHCAGNFQKMLPEGFTLESHEVILYGRCQTCQTS
ncbi:Uncharacterized protein AB751O23_AA_00200 [Chlamydiales bacterium SCGC AB-751-O23]|jgi:Fur family transcriptional regulator, ferric uptake regulator|nr:Uncharacterized protein AB751O23_AA_00200 [Chlamydiales bacterium SCGC AB-751-O23]